MRHHLSSAAFLFSAATLLAPMATAQLINWGPVLPTLAATDVSLDGTFVYARNMGQTTSRPTTTANGVTFTGAFQPTGWSNGGSGLLNTSTTGDTGYDNLLIGAGATSAAASANPTGWGAIRLDSLVALTVGHAYQIQCWYTDQRAAPLNDRVMTLSSAIGAATLTGGEVNNLGSLVQGPLSGGLDADPDNTAGVGDVLFGSYCKGTFTRTNSADQLWLLVQGTHPLPTALLRSHLNGFQIRDLGPAASMTFLGAGCAGSMPVSTQTVNSLPTLGGTLSITFNNLPLNLANVEVGFGTTFAGFPLPVDLGAIGLMPVGCTAYTSADMELWTFGAGNQATLSQAVPSSPSYLGFAFVVQAGVPDATVTTLLPAVASDAWSGVIGL